MKEENGIMKTKERVSSETTQALPIGNCCLPVLESYPTWFTLEQMLRFISRDMRHGGKDIATVCRSSLDAVSVIDASLSCLVVHVKVAEVIVEID